MRSKLLATTLAAVLLGGASLAHAQDTGWYAGVGAGQALVDERGYDDEDAAFSVFGGYQFHRNFALELGYTDFGKLEPRGEGANLEASSVSLAAVGILPFTEKFSGYAKAGLQRWDIDGSLPGLTGTTSGDGTDPLYGLGLQYRFTDAVALRGEYVRSEFEDADVDTAQVQVRFDF
ncbi:OOP family OmpA-OmpF porin [Luteimonas sp. J16]|jgi:OOP family OmpA-OmpF porin|uniref:outer membrane beta-barrel protein n=1 Tax=unclassified Luteimonas TaxID=2629088 RepID=UPI0004BA36E2|nr:MULTISPECIES: outer membrane beta-barrel protein [unclassified Luteimonas]TWG92827.1 OOP family OmpA-OmpF porin [Luteimonas sp. J16]